MASFLFALLTLLQIAPVDKPLASTYRVVGYYADWTVDRYPPGEIPAEKLTHVNYAFAKIDPDNRLMFNKALALDRAFPGDCTEPKCPRGIFHQIARLKETYPHLKFIMSVGGWTDSGPFYEMAASEAGRETFARSCADFLKTYPQFDGIDLDWEHPVAGGLQPGQTRDAHNYVLLLEALREAIGPTKLLTVAVGAGARAIDPLEYQGMAARVDWINVMTYDFHSGGTRAGFNSALYNHDDPSTPRSNTDAAVQAILAKGVPRNKLVVGVPFYGRGWRGIESADPWNMGTGTIQVGGYRAIAANQLQASGFVRHWDDVAKVPWLYNADTKEWITYEDAQSMRIKAQYIVDQGLAGVMFWELSNDDGTLLDALRRGLAMAAPH